MTKGRVLFIIPDLSHGGAEKVLVNLVNNMDKDRYDITMQTLFDVGVNRQFLKEYVRYIGGLTWQFRGNSKVMKLLSPNMLFRILIREEYDVIVSYLEGPTARIVSGCTRKETKLVAWIHSTMTNGLEASRSFRNVDETRKCYGRFDRVVAVSRSVAEAFSRVIGYEKSVSVLYNTLETDEIRRLSAEPINFDMANDALNLCAVGKIMPNKGFMRLAHIHKRLLDDGYKQRFFILGTGPQQAEIVAYLSANGISDTFIFLGYQTNPCKYVAKCDAFICASYSEGFSTAATEALIVGTPAITTLVSGMKEMLGEHDEYGVVVENDDEALYAAIKRMHDEPERLKHYKEMAKVRGDAFSTEQTVKSVESMLSYLCCEEV